jgi:leucine-rich PPR motif-containing protein
VNHAITTAGRMGRINDAIEIFNCISPVLGFVPDLMSFNNIIWCAGNSGRIDLAKKLFTDLSKTKLRPNVYSYGALMHGFAKTKSYKQSLLYLDRMVAEGVMPNQIVFTSAMEACAEAGQYKEALGVMERIVEMGLKPDRTMVNTAIKACSLAGAMDEAEVLAQSLRDHGALTVYCLLLLHSTVKGVRVE